MITRDEISTWRIATDRKLTRVALFKYLYAYDGDLYGQVDPHCQACYQWCIDNLGPENDLWAKDGVTIYSFRILFSNAEDAVAFKLKFGL
jgi:hypothetical protein